MIGKLSQELPNSWTLRIPSHIGPRYQSQVDLIKNVFKNIILTKPSYSTSYVLANTEWDFKINLFSSKKLLNVSSSSHKLHESIFTPFFRSYSLNEDKLP